MFLTKSEILKNLGANIIIKPFEEANLNENSYDITVGDFYAEIKGDCLVGGKLQSYIKANKKAITPELILYPGIVYLFFSREYFEVFNLVPVLTGRRRYASIGLNVLLGANIGATGFRGHFYLPCIAYNIIRLSPRSKIAQVCFSEIKGDSINYRENVEVE